jgi:hypothetical protein
LRVNFKVLSLLLNADRLADLILLCGHPMVKCRQAKPPVFSHANTRDSSLSGEPLKGLYVDAKVFRSLVGRQQGFKYVFGGCHEGLDHAWLGALNTFHVDAPFRMPCTLSLIPPAGLGTPVPP